MTHYVRNLSLITLCSQYHRRKSPVSLHSNNMNVKTFVWGRMISTPIMIFRLIFELFTRSLRRMSTSLIKANTGRKGRRITTASLLVHLRPFLPANISNKIFYSTQPTNCRSVKPTDCRLSVDFDQKGIGRALARG